MTEPMSKVEVEDVLSSIRRLVSDDVRVLSQDGKKSPFPRLLLTDALRVYPAPEPVRKPAPAVLVLSNPIKPPTTAPKALVPDPVPTDASAVVKATPASAPPRRLHLVTAADVAEETSAVASAQGASEIARRLAEIEALLNAQDHSPFETEALPSHPSRAQMSWDEDDASEAPFIDADLEPAPTASASIHWAAPLSPPSEQPAPDATFADDVAKPDAAVATSTLSAADEEILRGLVREVMLEELSGSTGERVTRNLRKIVRAEIARALTARGLT